MESMMVMKEDENGNYSIPNLLLVILLDIFKIICVDWVLLIPMPMDMLSCIALSA